MPALPTLTTARLVLRPFRLADAGTVAELLNDPVVSATLETIPFPYHREYAELWIPTHASLFTTRRELHLAIQLRESGHLIGAVGLLPQAQGSPPQLGYWLGQRYWGNGYATEAVREVVRFARCEFGVEAVAARCMVGNPASVAVLTQVGLRRVGRCQQRVIKGGVDREVDEFLLEFADNERGV
jgi:ribosomal-protein-alanine N-acetyltransferase